MKSLFYSVLLLCLVPQIASAQITPDNSLGAESSTVETNKQTDTINGGATRGKNLLHSFEEFNVNSGREAYFSNPQGIENIFSRVTGSNISNIDGVLGVKGNANLYLMNPNGIIFGKNSQLDVKGSFFATTADSVLFKNGIEFSAANPEVPPLLTIDIPIGLSFRENPQPITNLSELERDESVRFPVNTVSGLKVEKGQNISLIGGDIILENSGVTALGGNINLGGLSESGIITMNSDGSLSFPENKKRADVSLKDAKVDVKSDGGGFININARNLTLIGIEELVDGNLKVTGRGLFVAGLEPEIKSPNAVAGDINIDVTDSISLDNSFLLNTLGNAEELGGRGNEGNIKIQADKLSLQDAWINGNNFVEGNNGEILIDVKTSILLNETSRIVNVLGPGGKGNAGGITINTSKLEITNGARIDSSVQDRAEGNGGKIEINASESVRLNGLGSTPFNNNLRSRILSIIAATGKGQGGEIKITTPKLFMKEGSITSRTTGNGDAGNVIIQASEIGLIDSFISSNVTPSGSGNGGDLNLDIADDIVLQNGSQILTDAVKNGQGGDIDIKTNFIIATSNENNDILASAEEGNGGKIEISASSLFGIQERQQNDVTNDINADSDTGISGQITIEQPGVDPQDSLLEVTPKAIDVSQLIVQNVCYQIANSKFVNIGKGGLPVNPSVILTEGDIDVDLVDSINHPEKVSIIEVNNATETIQKQRKSPAMGWVKKEDGTVKLVAHHSNSKSQKRFWNDNGGCSI